MRPIETSAVPVALCVVLAGGLVLQFVLPQNAARVTGAPLRLAPIVERLVAAVPDYPAILSRPLFTPSRSSGGADSSDGAASVQLSDYAVVGVAVDPRSVAAFVRAPGGEVRTLHPGDRLLGWRVAGVRRDALMLEIDGRKRELPVGAQALAQPMVSPR